MFRTMFRSRLGRTLVRTDRSRLALLQLEDRATPATFTVNALTDTSGTSAGAGTGAAGDLRYCIDQANTSAGDDTIVFAVSGTVTLDHTLGTLLLTDTTGTTTIDGTGNAIIVSGDNTVGVFQLGTNASAALNALTVAAGNGSNGGGVNALASSTLAVSNTTFTGNNAGNGGGIYANPGVALAVIGSTFVGNTTVNGGGIFVNAAASLTVVNSTFSGNTATSVGGGLLIISTPTVVDSSTFSGNGANSIGGGIFNTAGLLTMNNSIVAGSTAGGDAALFGAQSGSNNIIENGAGVGTFFTNSLSGDPGLLPLADNGGPTLTHALAPGSIALDAGDASLLPMGTGFDQRGAPSARVAGVGLDVGAFEVQPPPSPPAPPPPSPPAPSPAPGPTPVLNAPDGTGTIRVLNPDGTTRETVTPYTGYAGRVVTTAADMTGDGTADIVTGADGHVKVFDGATGTEARSFFAFNGYRGGVHLGAGDLTGDGVADLVVTADTNGHVKVFDGATGGLVASFFAFEGHLGAVAVTVGDTDGDGRNELIVAAGTAAGVHVKVFDAATLAVSHSFVAAGAGVTRFALAAGDLNGDDKDDLVVAQGTRVTVLDAGTGAARGSFDAFEDRFLGVMAVQVDGDDILTAAEISGRVHVKGFDGQTFDLLDSYFPDQRAPSVA